MYKYLVLPFFNQSLPQTTYPVVPNLFRPLNPMDAQIKQNFQFNFPQQVTYGTGTKTDNDKYNNEKSNFNFAKSLPKDPEAKQTVLQVGHGANKIKGYYAKNPETGVIVYADENGRRYTKEAFENWEQLAKYGTFAN